VRDLVCEERDLSAIMGCYSEVKGHPPYHPAMMVALLLYAYTTSRKQRLRGLARRGADLIHLWQTMEVCHADPAAG
jgi:hypothetical protein